MDGTDLRPLHGPNLFLPDSLVPGMRDVVLRYMNEMKKIGDVLMRAIVSSLNIEIGALGEQFIDPLGLFRIFHYPPHNPQFFGVDSQAVGEHTDYGMFINIKSHTQYFTVLNYIYA